MRAKRLTCLFLCFALLLGLMPTTVFGYDIGETVTNTTGEAPADVAGAVWVAQTPETKTICGNLYEHTHGEKCYRKTCDHKNGHLSSCYDTKTEYQVCTDPLNHAHTGTVNISDVVEIEGTTLKWKTEHDAYPLVYGIYKEAYDEAYASAKYLKDLAGKTAGSAAVTTKTYCYTVNESAEPNLCTHVCTDYDGSCYTKLCLLTEHEHKPECYETTYAWVLHADVNGNGTPDENESYTVIYTDGETPLKSFTDLKLGDETPVITDPTGESGFVFDGWDPAVEATVATPATGNTITYNAKRTSTVKSLLR